MKLLKGEMRFRESVNREINYVIGTIRFLHHLLRDSITLSHSFYRCVDIGKYTMVGSNNRTCIRSRWTGQKPHCYGLNQENDYASMFTMRWCIVNRFHSCVIYFSGKSSNSSFPIPEWADSTKQWWKADSLSWHHNSYGMLVDASLWHTKVERQPWLHVSFYF